MVIPTFSMKFVLRQVEILAVQYEICFACEMCVTHKGKLYIILALTSDAPSPAVDS